MLTDYERRLLCSYLANIASGVKRRDPEARKLIDWIADRDHRIASGASTRRREQRLRTAFKKEKASAKKLRCVEESLREECADIPASPDRTTLRLRRLGKTAGLNRTDLDILELLLRYETHAVFESMFDDILDSPGWSMIALNQRGWAVPLILGLKARTIQSRLHAGAPLVRSGLVSIDDDGDLAIQRRLRRLATAPGAGNIDITRLLLDVAPPAELEWTDFGHVAADRDHVEKLLRGALDNGKPGVNVLLYGSPGTGKTEFCKALAARLGVTLYSVGEAADDGDEPSRKQRLEELRLAQRLIARDRRSLLLFDEMEDLLGDSFGGFGMFGPLRSSRSREAASRVFMHRLLEQAPSPTLWTMNDADEVSPAILRRMMFALELRPPTAAVRARVWARQLDRHDIAASPEEVAALACEFDAAPGVAATAAAGLAGGDIAAVRTGVRSLARLLSSDRPPQGAPTRFDPALIRADTDLASLADRLSASEHQRFSLCLQGPPGTGKSACVRYLAERLGLEVVQKRASDLMSMWVGQTEKAIARAFAEARDAGAFLVFDEADSLLADRRLAHRNWEVSQVNEMLTWMESHPLPFACTTNFAERLDPATLRRFVFKVTLDYLAPGQAETAFRSYFDLPPPPSLATLAALTPGDFAVVRNKAEILGVPQDPEALAEMLHAECAARPDRPRAIGFRLGGSVER
ncbi:MAG: ATP-binding protein [bacterium]|nr:ATP-binding protein [bacterium]